MLRTQQLRAQRAAADRCARNRRAALIAEFEGDLGIDHAARAAALLAERRWIRIKTFIVWTIAIFFFWIALQKVLVVAEQRANAVRPAGIALDVSLF